MAAAAIIAYVIGWIAFFYAIVPVSVQGPAGAWLYRACVLQPRSWALGFPFVAGAFLVATLWPIALVAWLLSGRRPPPLITTQALLDHYGVPYSGDGPALTRVPKDIPKRVPASRLETQFSSGAEFWARYFAREA